MLCGIEYILHTISHIQYECGEYSVEERKEKQKLCPYQNTGMKLSPLV